MVSYLDQALTLEADRVFKRTVKEDHDFNEFQQQREKVDDTFPLVLAAPLRCMQTFNIHPYSRISAYS